MTSNVTQKCQRHICRLFVSGVLCFKYALRNVLHENSDLLMKFQKEDEKNALLTEQNERQVLFCTVTSRLLHDDAKIRATSVQLYNVLENWQEMKPVFRRNILIRTGDFLILFYISIRYG